MTIDVHKTHQSNNLHLILLKTNDYNVSKNEVSQRIQQPDRYLDYISGQKTSLVLNKVNLLEFEFINSKQLYDKIFKIFFLRNEANYLILTSRQTIEAIEVVLKEIAESGEELIKNLSSSFHDKLQVYCVGDSTATRFKNLISKFSEGPLMKRFFEKDNFEIRQTDANKTNLNDSAEHKQNGLELSKLIIQDYQELSTDKNSTDQYRLFYPCSSIRKDDLSNELKGAHVPFDELHVYKTTHSPAGLENLKNLINSDLKNFHERFFCIVYFSPSCVDAVFTNHELSRIIAENVNKIYNISIGPSTSAMLRKYVGPVRELAEPSPKSLYEKIREII